MKSEALKNLVLNGLWKNNPGTVQLLGLCPLLAVSTTLVNAFTLGLATLFVLVCSNVLVALCARLIPEHLRLPIFVLIIAGFVTLTELFLSAYYFDIYESLGIFLALITTNCLIMGRAESYASKNPVSLSIVDGLSNGLGFMLILCLIGGLREWIGQGFILALLPPGAFILLGLIVAIYKTPWDFAAWRSPIKQSSTEPGLLQVCDPRNDAETGENA